MTDRWQSHAACLGCDPELFYSERGDVSPDDAYAVCATCPVTVECLRDALAEPPTRDLGVRAGTTPRERKRLRYDEARLAVTLVRLEQNPARARLRRSA